MGTAAVLAVLALLAGLAVRSLYKDKKKGKSISCGGDCNHCSKCHKRIAYYEKNTDIFRRL